jgi:DNA polymerase/3'-5' exonuclease PolX
LKAIRGIGDSIREKIQEIIQTGTLQKLQAFQSNEAVTLRIAFAKIWGVGPATAHQLVNKGYKL